MAHVKRSSYPWLIYLSLWLDMTISACLQSSHSLNSILYDNGGGGLALQCTHLEDAFLGKKP